MWKGQHYADFSVQCAYFTSPSIRVKVFLRDEMLEQVVSLL